MRVEIGPGVPKFIRLLREDLDAFQEQREIVLWNHYINSYLTHIETLKRSRIRSEHDDWRFRQYFFQSWAASIPFMRGIGAGWPPRRENGCGKVEAWRYGATVST
jgi:hypothetical protein